MNSNSTIICLTLFLSFSQAAPAQDQKEDENKNVSISYKTENYEFTKGNAEHPVLIIEQLSTTYKCNGFRTNIPFIEFYDNYTSIDKVSVYVNGRNNSKVVPAYSYFPVNDVFYSDAQICYFNLPLEEKNSESQVIVNKTINDPRYFTTIYFDEDYYTGDKKISIKVPNWMKLEIRELNFPPAGIMKQTEQKDDGVIYTYSFQNRPARKLLENAPGDSYTYPHLLILSQSAKPDGNTSVTYFQGLQDQYNWYHTLVQKVNNDASPFRMTVQEIVKGKNNDTEKIQAVFQWVQANIRYIAFENGIAAFKPENAQEVYRKKYGDCKGMANLTKEMLKTLGYDARLCWLGTNHIAYDHSIPSIAVDNHMICAVMLNGKFTFLDATEKYIGLGEFGERIQGREALIENGNEYILEKIPVASPMQNTITKKRLLVIDSLDISGTVSWTAHGESKEYFQFAMNSIASDKREITLKEYISAGNPNYKIQDLVITGSQDWNKDISAKFTLRRKNAVASFGNEKYLNMDLKNELADLMMDTLREQDVWLPYKYHFIDTTELAIPLGYTVVGFPAQVNIKNDSYLFNLKYINTGKKIVFVKEIMIMSTIIKKQQFKAWNAIMTALNIFYNEQIVLKKS